MQRRKVAILILLGLLAAVASGARAENLLVNSSFDTDYAGWSAWKPQGQPEVVIDDQVWHSGPGSLRITGFTPTDRGSVGQRVTVEGGTTYVFRAWAKTQEVSRPVARIRIQFNSAENAADKTRPHLYLGSLSGTHDWTCIEESFVVPEGTGTLTIEPFLDTAQGTVWWDDLELATAESEPLVLLEPSVRVMTSGAVALGWSLPAAYQQANVRFRVYRSPLPDFSIGERSPIAVTDDLQFTDRDTKPGQTYYYRVQPFYVQQGQEQIGDASPILKADVGSAAPVAAPLSFFADWDAGRARLTWNLGTSRARQIRLERRLPGQDWTLLGVASAWASEYIDYHVPTEALELVSYRITVLGPDWEETAPMEIPLSGFVPTLPRAASVDAHPRLLITQAEIDDLKAAAGANAGFKMLLDSDIIAPARAAAASVTTKGVVLPIKDDNAGHASLARQARNAALGYAFSGDLSMATAAKEILVAYAANYKKYPLLSTYDGHVTYQTLNESPWLIDIAWAYDLIWNSGLLTADDRRAIEDDLLWEAVRVIDRYKKGLSNWQAWHNAGIGAVAFLLNDQAWIDEILTGTQSFAVHIRDGIRADGIWWEQAIGYHDYTRSALTFLAEMAYRHGYDLYSFSSRGKSLKLMFDAPIYHAFTDGLHPVVGNTSFSSRLRFDWTYGLAAIHYQDPKYAALWKANMGGSGSIPTVFFLRAFQELDVGTLSHGTGPFAPAGLEMAGSSLFADTGMAVLRGGGLEAALLFKPHGTTIGHQAADNLTLMLEGHGGRWLPGTGTLDYGRDEQGTWYKQTVARNGVVVDETSQYPQGTSTAIFAGDSGRSSAGSLLHFVALPSVSIAAAATDNVYDGVYMERTVLLSAPYIIDRYRVASAQSHCYDWVAHFDARPESISIDQQPQDKPLGTQAGYQHITAVTRGETTDTWQAVWERNGQKLQLSMLGDGATQVMRANGYGPSLSPQPMAIARRQAADTEFVSVMECYEGQPSVSLIEPLALEGANGLRLLRHVAEDLFVADELIWSVEDELVELGDGKQARGRLAFFRAGVEGEVESLLLLAGTLVQTADLCVTSALPVDLALEKSPNGMLTVAHNSDGVRALTVRGTGSEAWRLFQWTNDSPTPCEITLSHQDGSVSWQADPGAIYFLGLECPGTDWLARFSLSIKP